MAFSEVEYKERHNGWEDWRWCGVKCRNKFYCLVFLWENNSKFPEKKSPEIPRKTLPSLEKVPRKEHKKKDIIAVKSFPNRHGPIFPFEGMIFTLTTSCIFNLWTQKGRGQDERKGDEKVNGSG
jgi:hypothetical protein